MAKGSGDTRVSRWSHTASNGDVQSLYYHNGKRVEYSELSNSEKRLVKEKKKKISKDLYKKLVDTTTEQVIDGGEKVKIHYTSHGIDHFCNDVMLNLSGKYFSKNSMMRVNEILEKSTYIPTSHNLSHPRTDGRNLWFSYHDADGRDVYLKVNWNNKIRKYELYSVVDKI